MICNVLTYLSSYDLLKNYKYFQHLSLKAKADLDPPDLMI